MSQQKPRQRGGRVLDKATPEQVMGLARNLPLTHSVLEKALEDATPGQLGFLANLFEKENASRAEDLVLYGDVGCGKTHLAIAIGVLACRRMIPVMFFTASSLVMRLRKAKDENRLDQELKAIGRAGLVIIDVFGDGDMAAAVIDRIVHHGRIIRFHGESYRNRHSLMK